MYQRRKSPGKTFLIIFLFLTTAYLLLCWFASQGELIYMSREKRHIQYRLDSIRFEKALEKEKIDSLKSEVDRLSSIIERNKKDLLTVNRRYARMSYVADSLRQSLKLLQ